MRQRLLMQLFNRSPPMTSLSYDSQRQTTAMWVTTSWGAQLAGHRWSVAVNRKGIRGALVRKLTQKSPGSCSLSWKQRAQNHPPPIPPAQWPKVFSAANLMVLPGTPEANGNDWTNQKIDQRERLTSEGA